MIAGDLLIDAAELGDENVKMKTSSILCYTPGAPLHRNNIKSRVEKLLADTSNVNIELNWKDVLSNLER